MPLFFLLFLTAVALFATPAVAAPDIVTFPVTGSDFRSAREAMVEAIESEGLVVGAILPFGDMLARTGGDAGSPYREAEIIQFCSSAIARQIVREDPAQIALCPMSVAIYVTRVDPGIVVLAYRAPAAGSGARREAAALLEKLVLRAVALAPLK